MANPRPLLVLAIATFGICVVNCDEGYLGKFTSYRYDIKGDVYKVEGDERKIQFRGFSIKSPGYEGRKAYFFVGRKGTYLERKVIDMRIASSSALRVRVDDIYNLPLDENNSGLIEKYEEDMMLELPSDIDPEDVGWVMVYCTRYKNVLAKMKVGREEEGKHEVYLGNFTSYRYDIKGDVYKVEGDERTIQFRGFSIKSPGYEGRKAYFFIGRKGTDLERKVIDMRIASSSALSMRVDDVYYLPLDEQNSGLVEKYEEDMMLELPSDIDSEDVGWVMVYCTRYKNVLAKMKVGREEEGKREVYLGNFTSYHYDIEGDVYKVEGDERTIQFRGFSIESPGYEGRKAYFFVGRKGTDWERKANEMRIASSSALSVRVEDVYYLPLDKKNSGLIEKYKEDMMLELPCDINAEDVGWVMVYGTRYQKVLATMKVGREEEY